MNPILGTLSQKPLNQYSDRVAKAAEQILAALPQTLLQLCGLYRQQHQNFWSRPGVTPQAIVAAIGLEKAREIFRQSGLFAGYLVERCKEGGFSDEQIAEIVPGVPDTFVVDPTATTVDGFLKARV